MRASSSTIRRLGFAVMCFSATQTLSNASEERSFERAFAVALAQCAGAAGEGDLPVVKHRHMVADFLDVGEGMRGDKQRATFPFQAVKDRFHAKPRAWVEACHRLVEHEQFP